MGVMEEILKNKEELILNFLNVVSGKEASAKVNLDGVAFNVGKSKVKLEGAVTFTLIPEAKRKK